MRSIAIVSNLCNTVSEPEVDLPSWKGDTQLDLNFYLWISVLETTKEEYFTPQQKVFVSVFPIKCKLAWYHVFNSANPHRVRIWMYAINGNSS